MDQGNRIQSLLARAETDRQFREELKKDPIGVIERELGNPLERELGDTELAAVSGGSALVYTCGYPGCSFTTKSYLEIRDHFADHISRL